MKPTVALIALALAGCAATTPVLPLGGDEFTVTAQTDWMSGAATTAQTRVVDSATAFCASRGQQVQPGELSRNVDQYRGLYDFSLRFRCRA